MAKAAPDSIPVAAFILRLLAADNQVAFTNGAAPRRMTSSLLAPNRFSASLQRALMK